MYPGLFSTTQTTNLSLRSSSALGSKQFATQTSKLDHHQTVEQGRRIRAQGILKKVKGRGHHSASEDEEDSEGEAASGASDAEMLPPPPMRSTETLADRKPPPFNASGSLGVVNVEPVPVATTSKVVANDEESPRPPPAPASVPAQVGSGLREGVTMTVVKRKKKEKGKMRAMFGKEKVKGKGKEVASDDDSDFDSSDSGMDGDEDDEKADTDVEDAEEAAPSDAESWHGIQGSDDGDGVPAGNGGDSSSDSDSSDEGDDDAPRRPPREKGAFREWAEAQVLSAAGLSAPLPKDLDPTSSNDAYTPLLPAGSGFFNTPHPDGLTGPLGSLIPEAELPTLPPQKSTHIPVERTEEMQKQREELPIVKEEDRLMEAIRGNAVIVVCGETGSGKTTQIGQFLLEAGWGDASSGALVHFFPSLNLS